MSKEASQLDKFTELIKAINKRPGMYHVSRVEDYELIFIGFRFSWNDKSVDEFIQEFDLWVGKKWENLSAYGWSKLIRLNCGGDSHSLELFSKLFNEYLNEVGDDGGSPTN